MFRYGTPIESGRLMWQSCFQGCGISDRSCMRALSIRQPYAELILRGIKPIEFRSRPTTIIGERFYIYASKQWAAGKLFLEGCTAKSQIPSSKSQSNPKFQIPTAA